MLTEERMSFVKIKLDKMSLKYILISGDYYLNENVKFIKLSSMYNTFSPLILHIQQNNVIIGLNCGEG